MRAHAVFNAPADIAVTITLSGSLDEFEKLAADVENPKNNYSVTNLLRAVSDASYKLRQKVVAEIAEGDRA